MRRTIPFTLAALLAIASLATAQQATGNIYGAVSDESGALLPGATVTLSGASGTRTTNAASQGEFRFLNLVPGSYKLTVGLAGFSTVNREVRVQTGVNVNLDFNLKVASVEESVTVTAETPLVDAKKRGTATTMLTEELQNIPNARDPWGVLRNVPGVLLDRVNIAGNENGQQASVAGKGTATADKMWNIDGLVITDMSATGASPDYFDFDAFEEIAVSTGGNDLQTQSGGININLTTKRGTNAFHGGGRFFLSHRDMSFGNVPDELANDSRLQGSDKADHIEQISDYGFDLGGPIVKDKLWFYGTYGKQDIRLRRLVQTPDKTLLPSYNAKLNWQASPDTMVSAFYFTGVKQKFGRAVGFPVNETDDFLWNQDKAEKDGGLPGGLWKLQADHTFSPSFFVSVKAAYYDTGFGLVPRGGEAQTFTVDYVEGEAIGSYLDFLGVRPQKTANLDGNYFFEGLGGNNELKFGFGYRDAETLSVSHFVGAQLGGFRDSEGGGFAWVTRDGITNYGGKYLSAYLGDVLSKDRFTLNLGLRFDRQTAKNMESSVDANASFPNLLPAISYAGDSGNVIEWSNFSPRVGLSYALNESRKTVLRASYASYAEQLAFGNAAFVNPVAVGILAYGWNDTNGDRFVQPNEVDLGDFRYSVNVDPGDPTALSSPNKIDADWGPKRDHEVVVGLDHELGANFALGAAYTWRRATSWNFYPRLAGDCGSATVVSGCPILGPDGYTLNPSSTANGFTAATYSPNPAAVAAAGGGRMWTDYDGYSTTFNGAELTLVKRLSNKWMGRVAFSYNDWVENFDGVPVQRVNFTTPARSQAGNPGAVERNPLVDGGQVTALSGGSGKAAFYTSYKWQLYANALVQLPWSLDLSGAVFGRQGGPYPISLNLDSGGADGTMPALATAEIDSKRYDNVWNLDLRLAKTVKLGHSGMILSAEWFNVLNNNVVLSRYRYANGGSFTNVSQGADVAAQLGRIEEILVPSIFRFGVRFTF
jgi:hypothetical protein